MRRLLITLFAANPLTIYSSLPLEGDAKPQSQDVVRGMRMALDEAGGQVNGRPIRYVSLNDATRAAGSWAPERVAANARRAVRDESTIAYLGEFNSGASAVSIPILNEAGIPQISPSNTYVGLTRREGGCCGEPGIYYPSGIRTFARVTPPDHLQARALAEYLRVLGVRRVHLVGDGEVYGQGLVRLTARRARAFGITVTGIENTRSGRRVRAAARRVARSRAQAMVYGGITQTRAVDLWRRVHRARPKLKLIGPDGVAESFFTERIPRRARARTYITNPMLAPEAYPAAGQDFFRRFRERFGKDPEPYAITGFEAMALALDAIARAGDGGERSAVRDALFATRDRQSVLGAYSIDANGDTTLVDYGGYRVSRGGSLAFDRVLRSGYDPPR